MWLRSGTKYFDIPFFPNGLQLIFSDEVRLLVCKSNPSYDKNYTCTIDDTQVHTQQSFQIFFAYVQTCKRYATRLEELRLARNQMHHIWRDESFTNTVEAWYKKRNGTFESVPLYQAVPLHQAFVVFAAFFSPIS